MNIIAILSTAHIHTRSFVENLTKATDGRRALVIWDDVVDRGRRYAEQCGATFEPDIKRVIRDRRVDGGDLGLLLSAWGPVTADPTSRAADLNHDGTVDGGDLGAMLAAWGG